MTLNELIQQLREIRDGDYGRGELPVVVLIPPNGAQWGLEQSELYALSDGEVVVLRPESD